MLDAAARASSSRARRSLLVVEPDDGRSATASCELLGGDDVAGRGGRRRRAALRALDASGASTAWCSTASCRTWTPRTSSRRCEREPRLGQLPIVLSTADARAPRARTRGSRRSARRCTVRHVQLAASGCSTQTAFFLHRSIAELPERRAAACSKSCTRPTRSLAGKKVLIVDDDIRNIFALTSVLEEHEMVIVSAENGRDAIEPARRAARHRHRADGHHDAGDGRLDTMRAIRKMPAVQGRCRSSR